MPNSKQQSSRNNSIAFIDFKPAELRLNKEWIIIYYAKNPITQRLDLFRLRVPAMSNQKERLKHGKTIVVAINLKLSQGWSPFFEESGKSFKTFAIVIEEFLRNLKRLVKDDVMRPDTFRTYNSNMNLVQQFVIETKRQIDFAIQIDKTFCIDYLDWIYLTRKNSPRTRNNHLGFLKLFCNFLLNRAILKENPAIGILPMKLLKKKRLVIPPEIRYKISVQLQKYNNGFYALCETTYYCFIRNTELGKIKVHHFDLEKGTIFLPGEISKNKKDEWITIPEQFKSILKNHFKRAKPSYFAFSADQYLPGLIQMPVRKIQNGWDRIKRDVGFTDEYQFYSLKDTGITDLLNSGVPAIKVRDQARHYDIKITELYTPRGTGKDEAISNASVKF